MTLFVSALIGKFGPKEYNVTMLYGNAESYMIPVSASEIQDTAIVDLARKLTYQLSTSGTKIPACTFFYDCKTEGSLSSASSININNGEAESNKWILSSFERIEHDELTALFNKIKAILSTTDFNGKFETNGTWLY